jgi:hypothetical protein
MTRLFFGTLLSNAQHELQHIQPLIIRASNRFFVEKSIDQTIEHLRRSQELLLKAKESYEYERTQRETYKLSGTTTPLMM